MQLQLHFFLIFWMAGHLLSAQPDTLYSCTPGQAVQLTAPAGQFAYRWSPAQGLNNPGISNPVARPEVTTLYVATIIRADAGENLIVNPDFADGNLGVNSDYDFVTTINTQGVYGVSSSAASLNGFSFADCPDHTSGTGLMLVVDGSPTPNERVWCQTVAVEAGADYAFSTWLTSVNPRNPARLQFSINGSRLGAVFVAGADVCDWRQFYAVWNAGNATAAEICIVNQNTNPEGNDFALDDFAFFKTGELLQDSTLVAVTKTSHEFSVLRKPDCGESNGAIACSSLSDGPARFTYSLNGGPFLPATVFRNLTAGRYSIIARNDHPSIVADNCSEEFTVLLPQGNCPFYLPAAFSPNSDGINDVFRVFTATGTTSKLRSFTIHNRWGGLVFGATDADPETTAWDGKVKGQPAASGLYLYQVTLEDEEGQVQVRRGSVILVR